MRFVFKNKETGEKVYIDSDDFDSFDKYMSDENWILIFE